MRIVVPLSCGLSILLPKFFKRCPRLQPTNPNGGKVDPGNCHALVDHALQSRDQIIILTASA